MLAMKDDQLPIAQEASMTSSSGSQEHSFGSRSALPILAKEFEPVFYRNPNITHVNPAITLDSAYR